MSDKAERVLSVWVSLNDVEREEAITLINQFQEANSTERHQIILEKFNESLSSVNFGPLDTGSKCVYCGRG